jgi:hypothetical protein
VTRDPGEVAIVLHTHLPWLKGHGVWPVGEEWLFQAWGESWYPVTRMLLRLADEGHRDVLTLGVTPLVAWQVADRSLRDDMGTWLGGNMWRSEQQRTAGWYLPDDVAALGPFYWRHYADLLAFHERVEAAGGLLAVWADLASRGVIELLGGPATHPYLPLHADEGLIDAQLATGLSAHTTWAGHRPSGIWVPEMGYRPRGPVADATAEPDHVDEQGTPRLPRLPGERPGLEEHYARHGISHFLVDAPTLVRAAGGADRDWTVRPDVPDPSADDPYEVVHDGVLVGDTDVVAFARDLSVAYHVWSPTEGYPGDAWYRDYFARGSFGLHPSWRVTDKALGPSEKAAYDPAGAARSWPATSTTCTASSTRSWTPAGTGGRGRLRHGTLRPLVVRRAGLAGGAAPDHPRRPGTDHDHACQPHRPPTADHPAGPARVVLGLRQGARVLGDRRHPADVAGPAGGGGTDRALAGRDDQGSDPAGRTRSGHPGAGRPAVLGLAVHGHARQLP